MKFKSIVCLLLLVVATTARGFDDEWSWGVENKGSSDSSSLPILEESTGREGHSLPGGSSPLNIAALPLEDESSVDVYEVLPLAAEGETLEIKSLPFSSDLAPVGSHGTASFSVIGEGEEVDGLVIAEGDREGRFLGLGEKLCSYGIGLNCAKKYPAPVKSHYGAPKPIVPQGVYGAPKPSVPQGAYGPPTPIKTHYGAPKPVVPKGTYGPPHHLPSPPVFPNRNYNVQAPTKAPFSPFDGILSVLKPFMSSSKPAPPKVSKGGVLSPSYTAPNPNYAPLLPSYIPPVKPTYAAPTPSYAAPPSVYNPPKPTYAAPNPSYAAPVLHVVNSKPAYTAPNPVYAPPKPTYAVVQPSYAAPKPAYAPPKSAYQAVQTSYTAPKRVYVEPKPTYINPVPTVTIKAQPTLVEQHHHTHTHVYNDKTVHQGIYKNDYNGVLESVHDSINQVNQHDFQRQDSSSSSAHVIHRQDTSSSSAHVNSLNVHVAQPSVNHVVQQPSVNHVVQRPHVVQQSQSAVLALPSIVPAVLVGGTNFQPGKTETGFRPSPAVFEPLFRPLQPAYREDCQCVAAAFCSDQDVVARNAPVDISNMIDARTKGSDILSNATESEEDTTEQRQSSARQGKVLALVVPEVIEEVTDAVPEETTENATEDVTEAVTEALADSAEETTEIPIDDAEVDDKNSRRRRRDTEATEEEEEQQQQEQEEEEQQQQEQEEEIEETEEDPAVVYSDRQGRQLTGFTPGNQGCGANHVCCRRPVFKPRRQQYTCGRRNAAGLLGRVKTAHFVQGDTEFGEYPWQAAILKRENGDMLYQCGGTLIDDKHILTAAHCVDGLHPSQIKIRLGEWDVSGQTEFYNHVEVRSAGVYLHPEFYAGNLNNDIAVIRLEHFVDFSSSPHITPVCLPDQFSDFTNQRCYATGWGKNAFGNEGKFSQILKEVEMPIMNGQHCQQSLQGTRLGASFALHEGNLCAGGEEGKDTCSGDGGGPLVCSAPDGRVQLAGLVSWGIGCGHPGVPGVYVKVSHYLEWIRDITRV